jgi:predicted dehydrogenase
VAAWNDYDVLFDRDDVDVVQISAPVDEIPDLAVRGAQARKHLIVGKPIATTVEQADRVVRAIDEAGVVCVPFQATTRLRLRGVKARIDRGDIGDLAVLHQTARWSIAEDWFRSGTPGWFADPARVPGGAFIDEGIYWLDAFRWLAGSEVADVHARMANLVHHDLGVEDWGQALLTMANGVRATLEASWTINAPRATGPSPKQNSVIRLEAVGTRGELWEQWFRSPGRGVLAAGASDWVYELQAEEPFTPAAPVVLDHLLECLDHGRTPIATIHDARASLAVALAAYQSAREGRTVRVG